MEQVLERPELSLKQKLKGPVYTILSDDIMMVLAILLIPAIVLPYVATFSPLMLLFFDIINYGVIAIFALEYVLKLYVSDARMNFIRDPWHILDLLIIVLAAADFLPFIQLPGGRLSPLLRLSRAFFVIGRTAKRVARPKKKAVIAPAGLQLAIKAFDGAKVRTYGYNELTGAIGDGSNMWVDIQNVTPEKLQDIAGALGISGQQIQNKLLGESFPRVEFRDDRTTIFIRDAKMMSYDLPSLYTTRKRAGILMVCHGRQIVTLSREKNDLLDRVIAGGLLFEGDPVAIRALCTIFELKMHDYEAMTHYFEEMILRLEEVPVKNTSSAFLDECFYLKKDISQFHNTLKHFKQVNEIMRGHKTTLSGFEDRHLEIFKGDYYETEYLHEIVENVRDNLISLIELHINTVSFDINRVIRLLSIITVLGIIPSIAFGLLGSNLAVAPFQATALEVVVIVLTLMFLALFIFYKAGWAK